MARILIASEFGSNLGHLGQMLPLASALQAQGDEVAFALRDLSGVDAMLRPRGVRYLQAPFWRPRGPRTDGPQPCSYSEILQHYGYLDVEGLLDVVNAWRELYAIVAPDAIVFEYAPTAMLAARCVPIPRFLYGDGFSLPPRVSPFPNFRTWEQIADSRLEESDAIVLDTVNHVLAKSGAQRLSSLQALLEADEEFLCTFPELDHYGVRGDARYRGSVFTSHDGIEPIWPAKGDQRVYVYLRPHMPVFDTVAEQLRDAPHSVLWVAPGVTDETRRRFESARFRFTTEPVKLAIAAAPADAAVLYGGHGTVSAMLLAGVPLALIPTHVEQALVAQRVVHMGAGLMLPPKATRAQVKDALARLLEASTFREQARAFASRYSSFDSRNTAGRIANAIGAFKPV